MKLPALNNPIIANAGAALCASSMGLLGTLVANLEASGRPPIAEILGAFAGIAIGALMCYVGRPSTIDAPPK